MLSVWRLPRVRVAAGACIFDLRSRALVLLLRVPTQRAREHVERSDEKHAHRPAKHRRARRTACDNLTKCRSDHAGHAGHVRLRVSLRAVRRLSPAVRSPEDAGDPCTPQLP